MKPWFNSLRLEGGIGIHRPLAGDEGLGGTAGGSSQRLLPPTQSRWAAIHLPTPAFAKATGGKQGWWASFALATALFMSLTLSSLAFTSLPFFDDFGYADETPLAGQNGWSVFSERPSVGGILPVQYHGWVGYPGGTAIASNSLARLTGKSLLNKFGTYTKQPGLGGSSSSGQYDKETLVTIRYVLDLSDASAPDQEIREESRFGDMFWHGSRYHYENPGSYYMMMPVVRYFVKTNGLVSAYNGHLIKELTHTPIMESTPMTVVVDYLNFKWSLWAGNELVVNNYGLYKPWRGSSVADYTHMQHDGWYKDYDGFKEVGFIDGTEGGVTVLDRVRVFPGLPTARAMPMIENFETRTMYGEEIVMQVGSLNGQNAWFATGASVATAAQNTGIGAGIQGAQINAGGEAFQLFLDGQTNVWTDLWMLPIAAGSGSANVDAGGGHAVFYVNDAGEVHAYDGTSTTNVASVNAGEWSRFTVHSDYAAKTWSLYIDGNLAQPDLAFKGDGHGDTYEELRFSSSGSAVIYMDDMVVHTESPFNLPSVSFATDSTEIGAGVTELTLTATLSWAFGMPITVDYVLQSDGTAMQVYGYTAGDGIFTFMPGETEQSVTFTITRDTYNYAEHDDTLRFVLTNLVNVTAGTYDQLTYTVRTNPEHFHVIPFSETFEHRALGTLHGQRGWQAKYVDVQSDDVFGGSKAARSERLGASLVHTFSNEPANVTVQWRAKPFLAEHEPTPPTGSTYAFYVEENGYIVAFDGTTATNMGSVVVLNANTWAQFRVNADYNTKQWTLFVNGTLVLQDFDFYDDSAEYFSAFEVHGRVTIDNIDIDYGPPATPMHLVAVATDSQVALSWSPAQGAVSYRLKRGTNPGGPYSLLTSLMGTSFTDTSTLNNITYYYVVSAMNAMGEGNNSGEAQATPRDKVTGLEAIAGIGRITLDWDAYPGATNYNVLRGTSTGGPYNEIYTAEVNSLIDSNVVNGVTYYYRVTADTDEDYTSMPSDEVSSSPALRTIFYDSFETPVVEGRIETSIPHWAPFMNETGAAGNRVGLWNEDSGSMLTPFGQQAAYVWHNRYIQTTSIEETLEADAYYLLTFNVAAEWGEGNIYYSAALMAGSTILSEIIAGWHVQENTFERADSIAFTVPEDHPAIGEPLGIRISYYSGEWQRVLGVDNVRLQTSIDPPPVLPDPLTFADGPAAISKTEISMTAESVTNGVGPITYRFENVTTGENSGWTDDIEWTNSGLQPGTEYGFRVKARDIYGNENEWSSVYTAETFGANVMTNNVGPDSWNNGDNWTNTEPPSGEESPRIASGVAAVVVAAPSSYLGNLILDTGSSVEFGNADAAGVLPGSGYQIQLNTDSTLRAFTTVDVDAAVVILGDAEVLAGSGANHVTFKGGVSGSGTLTLAGDTGNQFHFNAASTHTGGISTRHAADSGHRVYANVNNAFGTGDVEINAYASLYRLGGLSSTIANTATLRLNGAKDPAAPAKVVISGNETVFQLYVNGVVQPRGTHGSLASSAQHKSDTLFDGTGLLWVTVGDDDIYSLSTSSITESSAVLHGKLDVPFTSRVVRAHWSTNENAGAAWLGDEDASSVIVATYTEKVGQNLVRGLINLSPNTTYYYTFSASNAVDTIWGDTDTFATVGPPVLSNTGVSATGDGTAMLAGELTAGSFAETTFVWGTSDSGTNTIMDWAHRVPVGVIQQGTPITSTIENLTYGVEYRYRLYGENAIGSGWSGVQSFLSEIPRDGETILVGIAGADATDVTQTNATLQGVLDAPRATFAAHVYWSTNNLVTPAEWTAPGAADTVEIGTYQDVLGQGLLHPVSDLDYNTTYYYTFRIENPATNIWAAESVSFTTQGAPAVTNIGARNVAAGITELRGELIDGVQADAYLVWDTEDRGEAATNDWPNMLVVAGVTEGESFGAMATGLVYGVQYVYRVYVENAFGHDWSEEHTFWTLPPVEPEPLASGGVATNLYTDAQGKLWYAHVFTGNGTFTAPGSLMVEYMIVAGGGGGGGVRGSNHGAGGGGAGGLRTGSMEIGSGGYPVVVGAGGAGGNGGWSINATRGANGGNSSVFGITATGGGGGAHPTLTTGRAGGSGGGGAATTGEGGTGISGQGHTGGMGIGDPQRGGGGGGAGGIGSAPGGGPGVALDFVDGTDAAYATGGSGGVHNTVNRQEGASNTGNGGVGGSYVGNQQNYTGTPGGSGIVVVRYEVVPGIELAVNNTTVTNVTATSVDALGELDAFGALFDVKVYWSTNNNVDAAAWFADGDASSADVGTYTNVTGQVLQYGLTGLTEATAYYYTYMITNALTNVWASPNREFGTKGPPTVGTADGIVHVGYGTVTLQGGIVTGGLADAWFVWGDEDGLNTSTGDWANVVSMGEQLQGDVFENTLSNLVYGVEYTYRVHASNEFPPAAWSDPVVFTSGIPMEGQTVLVGIENTGVSGIGAQTATIHGLLHATQSVFNVAAYWSTVNYGSSLQDWLDNADSQAVGNYTNVMGQAVSVPLTGLIADQNFYYTFVATNAATNLLASPIGTFATEGLAIVSTAAGVTNVGIGTADLRAELTSGGVAHSWIVWGMEDGETDIGEWDFDAAIGEVLQGHVFTQSVSNLLYGVTHYYRAYVTNANNGAWSSPAEKFTTLAPAGIGVQNDPVADVGLTTATLRGNLNATQSVFSVYAFLSTNVNASAEDWRDDTAAEEIYVGSYTNVVGESLVVPVEDLALVTTYHYAFLASNVVEEIWASPNATFSTVDQPVVAATDATAQGPDMAQLAGMLTGGYFGEATVVWDRSDRGTSSTGDWSRAISIGTVTQDVAFSVQATELLYGPTYHYRVFVENEAESAWSDSVSFTTDLPAGFQVSNVAATDVGSTDATLPGMLHAPHAVFAVHVYWSTNDNADVAAWTNDLAASSMEVATYTNASNLAVSQYVDGLLGGETQYYYTFVASNALTTAWASPNRSFRTAGAPAVDNAGGAANVTPIDAILRGRLTAGGVATAYFAWGTEEPADADVLGNWHTVVPMGSVQQDDIFTHVVEDLIAPTTYYYRVYVTNDFGHDWSVVTNFTAPDLFNVMTNNTGGTDSWNTDANWTRGNAPAGMDWAIINTNIAAQANTAPPSYDGALVLRSGASLRFDNANGSGVLPSSSARLIMEQGAILRAYTGVTIQAPVILEGDASVQGGQSTAGHHGTRQFNSTISGTGRLTFIAVNNNTLRLNAANTFSGGFATHDLQSQRHQVQASANGAFGSGDVFINSNASLQIDVGLTDAISDSASLHLNGNPSTTAGWTSKLILYGSDTVYQLWIEGVQQPGGTYTSTESWIDGEGTLTVLGWPVSLENANAENVEPTTADLTGAIDVVNETFNVVVYWSTNNNADAAAWLGDAAASNMLVGAYSAASPLTAEVENLTPLRSYYYTFRATNALQDIWANPNAQFFTPGVQAQPVVTTAGGASVIGVGTATLNGLLTAGGGADATIVWGTSDSGTNSISDWQYPIAMGQVAETFAFDAEISGLFYGPAYAYRVYVTNTIGQAWSELDTFVTLPPEGASAPAITNTGVANVTMDQADLVGQLHAPGSIFTVRLYWSETNHLTSAAWQAEGAASSREVGTYTNVSAYTLSETVGDLESGALYYYTYVAQSHATNIWGTPNGYFGTVGAPTVDTVSGADPIGVGEATLNGRVSSDGGSELTAVRIYFGTSDGLDNPASWDAEIDIPVGGITVGEVFSTNVTGLVYGQEYYYRVYAANGHGSAWSTTAGPFASASDPGVVTLAPISAVTGFQDTRLAKTIDGSGMTLHDPNDPSTWRTSSDAWADEWQGTPLLDSGSSANNKIGWIAWDLGGVTDYLEKLYLWNLREGTGQNRRIVTYNVYYATSPVETMPHLPASPTDYDFASGGWILLNTNGVLTLPQRTTGASPADAVLTLGGISARYLALEILTNNGDTRVGMAEVGATRTIPAYDIQTTSAANIGATTADLQGSLDATQAVFTVTAYWSTNNNANATAWAADLDKDSAPVGTFTNVVDHPLDVEATGLIGNTTYYYTFVATNAATSLWAENASFKTLPPATEPEVEAGVATEVGPSFATLQGLLTAGGAADAYFVWGPADAGAESTGAWAYVSSPILAIEDAWFSLALSDLLPGTEYAYRVFVTNSEGSAWSDPVQTFTTWQPRELYRSGSGDWDTSREVWSTVSGGPYDAVAWTNINQDTAVFEGVSGTSTLTEEITVGGLRFDVRQIIEGERLTLASGTVMQSNVGTGNNTGGEIRSVVSGTNGFTKTGSGWLRLTATSSDLTGDIKIGAGTLNPRHASLGTGNIIFTGDSTLRKDYNTDKDFPETMGIIINPGVTATIGSSSFYYDAYFAGVLAGDETSTLILSTGNNSELQFRNNVNTFTGELDIRGTQMNLTGKAIEFNSLPDSIRRIKIAMNYFRLRNGGTSMNFTNRQLELSNNHGGIQNSSTDANVTMSFTKDLVATIGNNARTFTLAGVNTGDNTFSGAIADSANGTGVLSLSKQQTGKWILAGTNTYSGNTTVSAGTLSIENNRALPAATTLLITGGAVTLADSIIAQVSALTLDGEAQASGVYGSMDSAAPNKSAFFTGSGLLYVGVAPPAVHSLSASNVTLATADLQGVLDTEVDEVTVTSYWSTNNHTTLHAWLADGFAGIAPVGTFDSIVDQALSAGASGLVAGTTYYYTFVATNETIAVWASPNGSFTTVAPLPPVVDIAGGATNIVVGAADLQGVVTTMNGTLEDVRIYFGTEDGGTTPGNWATNFVLDVSEIAEGVPFATNVTELLYGIEYNYRVYASNAFGNAWSDLASLKTISPSESRPSLKLDFNRENEVEQYGDWAAFTAPDGTATVSRQYATPIASDDEVTVTIANMTHWRRDAAITSGPFVGMSDLLRDGPMRNADGTITLTLSGLSEGVYNIVTYNHRTDASNGGGTLTMTLTDAVVTDEQKFSGVTSKGTAPDSITTNAFIVISDGGDVLIKMTRSGSGAVMFNGFELEKIPVDIVGNTAAANITTETADLQGMLNATQSVFTVTAYWSTNDHATAQAWLDDTTKGSTVGGTFTNVMDHPVSIPATGLTEGTTYYYTLVASNAATNIWATPNATFATLMPETDPPVLLAVSPTNNAVNVAISSDLVATFDEPIYLVAGKTITVTNLTVGTATVITLPNPQVTTAISNLVINLAADLDYGAIYAVLIENGAITDFFENGYEGIASEETWQFATVERPVIITKSPENNATGVIMPAKPVATFNEAVTVADASGIVLHNVTLGTTVGRSVSVTGDALTISPAAEFAPGHTYAVQISGSAIVNDLGAPFAGIADNTTWRFTATTDINWSLVAYWPLNDGEAGTAATTADEKIKAGLTFNNGVTTGSAAGASTWENDAERGIVWRTVQNNRFNLGTQGIDLEKGFTWSFWVRLDEGGTHRNLMGTRQEHNNGIANTWHGFTRVSLRTWNSDITNYGDSILNGQWHHIAVVGDTSGRRIYIDGAFVVQGTSTAQGNAFNGLLEIGGTQRFTEDTDGLFSDVAIWNEALSTNRIAALAAGGPVMLMNNPVVGSFSPTNGASVRVPPSLSVTFDQNMQKGAAGNITIMNLTSSTSEVIPISSSRITISGTVVTITPTSLVEEQTFGVLIDYGALESVGAAMPFAGIVDTETWRFNALNNGSVFRFR